VRGVPQSITVRRPAADNVPYVRRNPARDASIQPLPAAGTDREQSPIVPIRRTFAELSPSQPAMRILPVLLLAAITTADATVRVAAAQTGPRKLSLVPDLRLDARKLGIMRGGMFGVGPAGQVISGQAFGMSEIQGFDSVGAPLPWKIGTGRGEDVDISYPTRVGWVSATGAMWFNDVGYRQVALVDRTGKVTRSIEFPSWVHPSWSERRKYPVFGYVDTYAVYADESMLVLPSRPRSLIDTPGYDRSATHLLRTSWSGSIQRTVATLPANQGRIELTGKGCNHTVSIPFAARTEWSVSTDGMRISIVQPGTTGPDSGTFRLIALNDRGDTTFARRYPQPAVRMTPESATDFLSHIGGCGNIPVDEIRAQALRQIPEFRSYVTGVATGRDHSAWVMMRAVADTAVQRRAVIIDARGDLVGEVPLPINQTVIGVDRDHLWTLELGKGRALEAVVRYKVVATVITAPPIRSAPASASSRPSHPPT
jgi:hypothetical protein